MPGTVLSTGDTAVTEKAKRLLREFVLIKFQALAECQVLLKVLRKQL